MQKGAFATMKNVLHKKDEGFTIIEVLIVLAIAGLIMLIVFLAVPALQRNSRNEGRRSDAGRVAGSISDFVANNNGNLPTEPQMATVMTNVGNLARYATTDRVANAAGTQGAIPPLANQPRFRFVTGARCHPTTIGNTEAASARQGALQYQLETPNSTVHTNACLDL